jgi:tetratricopeptide (TPR) repeat protein
VTARYDVFMSYAHADFARVKPLVAALQASGLRVWFDDADIADFTSITRAISDGIANAKALLAFYSDAYPTRRACQSELTAAFLAAQQEGDPRSRVLVINPESDATHIHPVELRDALFLRYPISTDELARSVRAAIDKLSTSFCDVRAVAQPPWYGGKGLGSNRFVGRIQYFWLLHSLLFANNVAVITAQATPGNVQVRGMGGIGKSLLAEEYALRFGSAYPGGVFVLKGSGSRDQQISDFAARLGLAVGGLDAPTIDGWLQARLREAGRAYLWLVDDLPGGISEDERRAWFAPNGLGKTLLTTRSRENDSTGGVIDLGVLALQEGYELLTARRSPVSPKEETAARDIVAELGRHALAIDVAGGALFKLGDEQTFAGFLARVRAPGRDELAIAAQLQPDLPNGHERSIASTLLSGMALLDDTGRDFLRLASILAADVIPNDLIVAVLGALGSEPTYARMLTDTVVNQSLAEASPGGYSVHALVARTMRLYDGDVERRGAIRRISVDSLNAALPAVADARSHQGLEAHVAQARHLAAAPQTVQDALLLLWVGRHDFERGAYASAREHEEVVLREMRRLLGDEHPLTVTAKLNLAGTMYGQGEFANARQCQEEVLDVRRRYLEEGHPEVLAARGNLAATLQAQGEIGGARAQQELVLEGYRLLFGEEHSDTIQARSNLAITLSRDGKHAVARAHEEAVLDVRVRLYGNEHPLTLVARDNLASTLNAQGEFLAALAHQEAVAEAMSRLLGADHPKTLTARNNLAMTLLDLGHGSAARVQQQAIVDGWRRLFGEEQRETLWARLNLAGALAAQGDFEAARGHQEEVLAIMERSLGDGHLDTLRARLGLASTLFAQGERSHAQRHQEVALAGMRRLLGDEHPDTLTARSNLAGTLFAQGAFDVALEHQEAVLAMGTRLLGAQHPDNLRVRSSLADTLFAIGDLQAAREHQQAILEPLRRLYGADHHIALVVQTNLAHTLFSLGELSQARSHQESVVEKRRRALGDDHPHTINSRIGLVEIVFAQGDLPGLREHQGAVFEALRRSRGDEDFQTLQARNILGVRLAALGDFSSARMHQEAVLETTCRLKGAGHPNVLRSRLNLIQTLIALRDLTSARSNLEAVVTATERLRNGEYPDIVAATNALAALLDGSCSSGNQLDAPKTRVDPLGARLARQMTIAAKRRMARKPRAGALRARLERAHALFEQGDYSGALERQAAVLEVVQGLCGEQAPETILVRHHLARTLFAQGDLRAAREQRDIVFEVARRCFGEEHPNTLNARVDLANTLFAQREFSAARAHQEALLEVAFRSFGNEHPHTLDLQLSLADTLLALDDVDAAREQREAAEAKKRHLERQSSR